MLDVEPVRVFMPQVVLCMRCQVSSDAEATGYFNQERPKVLGKWFACDEIDKRGHTGMSLTFLDQGVVFLEM